MFDNGNTVVQNSEAETTGTSTAVFEEIKSALHQEFGETNFRSWISPVSFAGFAGGTLVLSVPSRFVRDWVRSHYSDSIQKLWSQKMKPCLRLEFMVEEKKAVAFEPLETANENSSRTTATGAPAQAVLDARQDLSSPLDPRFTFDNFVTGPSNALAQAAARRLSESDAPLFNPLYLQGGVGLGKTHLMQAAAHAIRARRPDRRVVYMSAEKFMFIFVRALRARDTMSFKEAFRAVDVLMIDDVQFICGKETTQQEFFHTMTALIDQGKQVILSADRAPADLDGLDDRLRSRLGMGLVAAIEQAPLELRLEILRAKCRMIGREMPENVLSFLAEKITSNIREVEGALNRLVAHAELVGRAVTLETAQDLLKDILRAHSRRLSVEDIQKAVAERYGIRVADILSPRRARPLARPRQIAMYLSKALTEHSLPDIGRKFGGRDHTTIIHGVRKVEELMAADAAMRDDVESLKRALSS